jgi:hypothetical protein
VGRDVPAPWEISGRLRQLSDQREHEARRLRSLAEIIPEVHELAYRPLTGRDVASAGGGTETHVSDPTTKAPAQHQAIMRDGLRSLLEHVDSELAHAANVDDFISRIRRTLRVPRAPKSAAERPTGPPLVDSEAELEAAHAAQKRRRARGEL